MPFCIRRYFTLEIGYIFVALYSLHDYVHYTIIDTYENRIIDIIIDVRV